MIDKSVLRADWLALIADMPVTASYSGITVQGVFDEQSREDGLELTGQNVMKQTTLYLPTTVAPPAERERVDIQFDVGEPWESWRADSITASPDRIHNAITLKRWNRNDRSAV